MCFLSYLLARAWGSRLRSRPRGQGLEPSGKMEQQDLMVAGAVIASNVSPVKSRTPLSQWMGLGAPRPIAFQT
jgi:hypothetical protein